MPRSRAGSRDPFEGFDVDLTKRALEAAGWKGLRADGHELALEAGELVFLVTTSRPGDETLKRLCEAHGSLPAAPSWQDGTQDTLPTVRVYRAPQGPRLPDAVNLHGIAPGVSVFARGERLVPPSHRSQVDLRWSQRSHPSLTPLTELPAWLAEIARDPTAAARAWSTTRPAPGAVRTLAEWERGLTRNRGRTVNSFGNICKIMRSAPQYAGRFRLNRMTQAVEFEGKVLPETHVSVFREQIEDAPYGGFAPGKDHVYDAVRSLAEQQAYHPVQQYLEGLPKWDGTERLRYVAAGLLHAEADELTSTMVARWFLSAVARALKPGCQVDTALVLVGPQGYRKSSFFRAVAGDAWFADTEVRIGDKDGLQQIHAAWITEWGELDRITGARHAGEIKAFISRRADTFRPPYGRVTETFQRSCVIVGSTNEAEFLADPTGSRRFWVVRVGAPIEMADVYAAREQLWAEAVHRYRAGEPWWLDAEQDAAREVAAEQYRVRDIWESIVARWLIEAWPGVRIEKRYPYLTTDVILRSAIKFEVREMDRPAQNRVGKVMAALGYVNRRRRVTKVQLKECPGPELVHAWLTKAEDEAPAEGASDDVPT